MVYFWSILLIVLNLFWLALDFLYLPGNWLMVISTAIFAWRLWDDGVFSIWTVAAITILAAIGELVEFFAGMGGARTAGAGWRGALAAIAGAVAGAVAGTFIIPVPFLGTLLGAAAGAGFATWLAEHAVGKDKNQSAKSGLGAGVGVLVGMAAKIFIGFVIWLAVVFAIIWH